MSTTISRASLPLCRRSRPAGIAARTGRLPALGILALALALASTACGFGLFQTARTEPPGTVVGHVGTTSVHNEVTSNPDRGGAIIGVDSGMRLGVADHVDVRLRSFLLSGMQFDVKVNVMRPSEDLALAPRIGGGYAARYDTRNAILGVIGSYRIVHDLEPYLGLPSPTSGSWTTASPR